MDGTDRRGGGGIDDPMDGLTGTRTMSTPDTHTDRRPAGRDIIPYDLAERIEDHIKGRTAGQVRDLLVTCVGGLIFLQGRCRAHDAKRAAQEAALDLTEGRITVVNQIVVR
jgi:hypothetical protein